MFFPAPQVHQSQLRTLTGRLRGNWKLVTGDEESATLWSCGTFRKCLMRLSGVVILSLVAGTRSWQMLEVEVHFWRDSACGVGHKEDIDCNLWSTSKGGRAGHWSYPKTMWRSQ